MSKFLCSICHVFASPSFGGVLRHISNEHAFEANFQVVCGVDGCQATYKKLSSWKSHLYRNHKGVTMEPSAPTEQTGGVSSTQLQWWDNLEETMNDGATETSNSSVSTDLTRQSALFILKTRDGGRLTQAATDNIVKDVSTLFQSRLDELCRTTVEVLKEAAVDDATVASVKDVMTRQCEPFSGLETEYRQNAYIRDHFGLIEPQERVLGYEYKETRHGTAKTNEYCYDVPLLKSLQGLLKCDSVIEQIFNTHQMSGNILGDYCDGELCRQHALFGRDHHALQIILYYDDAEVVNPLGSSATIHKLGLFYYTLGNLEPRLRSPMNAIQLVSVVRTTFIDKYGIDTILEPFVNDIIKLESDAGVAFDIQGEVRSLRGSLALVCADNPAAHLLGGFKSLTSALRRCRVCLATNDDVQAKFTAEELAPRTAAVHDQHCRSLNGPLRDHMSTAYGVSRNSILNSLKYYHVINGIPVDVMHDVLEGVLQLEMSCLLNVLIGDLKLFSLDTLNRRISNFPYGTDVSDPPKPLSHLKVKMGASETWALGRLLPLLVGDLVPEGNDHWNLFLTLLQITEIVMAPRTTVSLAAHTRDLIAEHHSLFTTLYPDRPLTPKCHYMVHIPKWMTNCGPLSHIWCMRFEAKHHFFKYLARLLGNFKNISKSMIYRHQRHMCYVLSSPSIYLRDTVISGPVKSVEMASVPYQSELMEYNAIFRNSSRFQRTKWIKICGTLYNVGAVVLTKFQEDMPVFGRIVDIILHDCLKPLFVTDVLDTQYFNRHFYAYQVKEKAIKTYHLCRQRDLADYHTLSTYTPQNSFKLMIPLKYYVLSDFDL